MRHVWLLCCLLSTAVAASAAAGEASAVRLMLNGRPVEGKPLHKDSQRLYLLGRDGALFDFRPHEMSDLTALGTGFRSYSQAEIRGQLVREFGKRFEVSGTGHYLVVHPAGQRDQWAQRFEDLYRSFVHYFSARGFRPRAPQFPMVAVVFSGRDEFARFAAADGGPPAAGLLGYYSMKSNRVLLYDQTSMGRDWHENAETIIHEATHQTAFNTGVHSRFSATPRWLAEGLGTMFEARGVWDSQRYTRLADRLNAGRLASFRQYAATRRKKGTLAEMVASDRMFHTSVDGAYAESWALAFFLAETEPRKFMTYVAKTARLTPFADYEGPQRLKDFTDIFGSDLGMLEARMLRFVDGLP
jgi:hypothetical protein